MLEQQLGFNYQMAHLPRSANSANSAAQKWSSSAKNLNLNSKCKSAFFGTFLKIGQNISIPELSYLSIAHFGQSNVQIVPYSTKKFSL